MFLRSHQSHVIQSVSCRYISKGLSPVRFGFVGKFKLAFPEIRRKNEGVGLIIYTLFRGNALRIFKLASVVSNSKINFGKLFVWNFSRFLKIWKSNCGRWWMTGARRRFANTMPRKQVECLELFRFLACRKSASVFASQKLYQLNYLGSGCRVSDYSHVTPPWHPVTLDFLSQMTTVCNPSLFNLIILSDNLSLHFLKIWAMNETTDCRILSIIYRRF